jgi:hypothetical protein
MDTLDETEKLLLKNVPEDEELLLMEQIQLFSIRERRILNAIKRYQDMKSEVAVEAVNRMENKRSFKDSTEEAEYDRRQTQKVDAGDILPGKPYNIQTHTTNKDLIIARLEQELSTVQSKKTKSIELLAKIRREKREDSKAQGDGVVDDWIAAVMGGDDIEA